MSFKRACVLKGIILPALFFSFLGFGMVFADDCPKLFLRISGEGLFPYNIQWFEKSNEMYFGLASGSISPKAAANASEPEFTYFLPGMNAELDLAVSPRLMLGLGFGWVSRDWNPEWNFSDNSKTSYGPYKIDAVESISTGIYSVSLQPRYAFLRSGPFSVNVAAAVQYNIISLKYVRESYSSSIQPGGRRWDSAWESNYDKARIDRLGYSLGIEGECRISSGLAFFLGGYYQSVKTGTFMADTMEHRNWTYIEGELIPYKTEVWTDQPVNGNGAFNLSGPVLRAGIKIRLF